MKTPKDFAARFYGPPNCQEHHYVFTATSAAKARWAARRIATEKDWRLVEVFLVPDRERFKEWYGNHVTVTL